MSYAQMKVLFYEDFPNKKAEAVGANLRKNCLKGNLYVINPLNVYEKTDKMDADDKIKTMVSKFIQASCECFSEDQMDFIQKSKKYNSVITNKAVNGFILELKEYITNNEIEFDKKQEWKLHFKKGYLNLKTGKLEKREYSKDYITWFINRDYKKAEQKHIDTLCTHINKIYPIKEDRDAMLSIFGRSISGTITNEQSNLFMLGTGSSGKSLLLKLMEKALECYFQELKGNTFEQANQNINKTLNQFDIKPTIRITWINEMTSGKMNDSMFKEFCEGRLQTSKLFKDVQFNIVHQSKLIFNSNEMPNIKLDSGVSRRTEALP